MGSADWSKMVTKSDGDWLKLSERGARRHTVETDDLGTIPSEAYS